MEADETFSVLLGVLTNIDATAADDITKSNGSGTITNDDTASLTVMNVTADETNAATTTFTFDVKLDNDVQGGLTVAVDTQDGTAKTADSDYDANTGSTIDFTGTKNETKQFQVTVNGDTKVESDETFSVLLGVLTNIDATAADDITKTNGIGTITNDDTANLTVINVIADETNAGTTTFTFDVKLNNDVQGGLTVAVNTQDGSAKTSDNDYVANTGGTIDFAGNKDEIKPFQVTVNGDLKIEPDEDFSVLLGVLTNIDATAADDITKTNGTGTIRNDDFPDFGDAPDPTNGVGTGNYQTRENDGGPLHIINNNIRMGAEADTENDGQPNGSATGDDAAGSTPDDEDGLTDPSDLILLEGTSPQVRVRVTNLTAAAATLYGWIDINKNGVFENTTERTQVAVAAGSNDEIVSLSFPQVPLGARGDTFARFRLSTYAAAANSIGIALDGEVEDYQAKIVAPDIDATLVDDPGVVEPGEIIHYTAEVTNSGDGAAIGVSYDVNLDGNAPLVPGSIRVTPIAFDDVYATPTNVQLNVTAANGVLKNDVDPDHDANPGTNADLTAISLDTTDTQGTVTLNADGSFDYNPVNNFTGLDSFRYTALDQDNLNSVVQGIVYISVGSNNLIVSPGLDENPTDDADAANRDETVEEPVQASPLFAALPADAQRQLSLLRWGHGFYSTGNLWENWGGRGEVWIKDRFDRWHFVTPDGGLYRYGGNPDLTGSQQITELNPLVHGDLNLLFGAEKDLDSETQQHLTDLQSQHGFYHAGNDWRDWAGIGEIWIKARDGAWHYLTPQGEIYRYGGNRDLSGSVKVGDVGELIYRDPALLLDAGAVFDKPVREVLSLLQATHDFRFAGDYWHNWAGQQEKWFKDELGNWHYLTPEGGLYRYGARRDLLDTRHVVTLVPAVYDHLEALFHARPEASARQFADGALTSLELSFIAAAARRRWSATGLSQSQQAALNQTSIEISHLSSNQFGTVLPSVIRIDNDAAGFGWYVDPTPQNDEEFANAVSATRLKATAVAAGNHIDLLSAVFHEMGHVIGLPHVISRNDVMNATLERGERRLPAVGQANRTIPSGFIHSDFLSAPINIGTLPSGKKVQILYDVRVNNPVPQEVKQIVNQGVVAGSNFTSVATDDPSDPTGTADPTRTDVESGAEVEVALDRFWR